MKSNKLLNDYSMFKVCNQDISTSEWDFKGWVLSEDILCLHD